MLTESEKNLAKTGVCRLREWFFKHAPVSHREDTNLIHDVGARVRSIRKQKKLTLTELAQETGLSPAFLSNLERNLCSPTLENIQRICSALDISLLKLLEDKNWGGCVLPAENREVIFEQKNLIRYESINFGPRRLEGLLITIQPHCEYSKNWTHSYDEIGYILEGEMTITIENQDYPLKKGDSFYIDSMQQHSLSNHSDAACTSLWVKQPAQEAGVWESIPRH